MYFWFTYNHGSFQRPSTFENGNIGNGCDSTVWPNIYHHVGIGIRSAFVYFAGRIPGKKQSNKMTIKCINVYMKELQLWIDQFNNLWKKLVYTS